MFISRKHFEAVAEVIEGQGAVICADTEYGRGYEDGRRGAAHAIALNLAQLFAESNQNFNHRKFMEACGFGG